MRAKKAVVSNASMWDTLGLLPEEVIPKSYSDRIKRTPQCESFMHLHLGFDAQVSIANIVGDSFLSPSSSYCFIILQYAGCLFSFYIFSSIKQ